MYDVFRMLPFTQSFTKTEKRIPKSSTTIWRTNSKYHSLFFIWLSSYVGFFSFSWWNFEQMAASWTRHVSQPNISVTLTFSLHDVFRTLPFAQSFTKREKRIPKSSTTVWRTNYGTLSTPPQKLSHHRVKTYMKTSR